MFAVHQLHAWVKDVFFLAVKEVQEAFYLSNRFPSDSKSIVKDKFWEMNWIEFQELGIVKKYEFLKVVSSS